MDARKQPRKQPSIDALTARLAPLSTATDPNLRRLGKLAAEIAKERKA
jgi:hypothetical protein